MEDTKDLYLGISSEAFYTVLKYKFILYFIFGVGDYTLVQKYGV